MTDRRVACLDCGGTKGPGKGHRWCSSCMAARRERRRSRGRGIRGLSLKPRYGITIAEYDSMLASQDGTCAICRRTPPTNRILKLAVDHNHATGEIRGLVCQRCNMALHFLENRTWYEAARRYLDDPPARAVSLRRCSPLLAEASDEV